MTTPLNILPENALLVTRGSSKTLQLTVRNRHRKPQDLTGARILFTVKRTLQDSKPLISKTTDHSSQILFTNPKVGQAQIFILPEDTQYLEIRDYLFDVWVVLASGNRYVVVPTSIFSLQAGVTIIP